MRGRVATPFLLANAASSVGFSVYVALGLVADRGLGLTPLILAFVGLLFSVTTMTYVEGGAMFRERGGSANFARHAFNELVGFIAGWAILIDYLIVIAIAAITVPHYLTPISSSLGRGVPEVAVAGVVIAVAAGVNIVGVTGRARLRPLALLGLADIGLQLAVIVVGATVVFEPSLLTAELDLFSAPPVDDIIYAAVLGSIAFAGIEAASYFAPEADFAAGDLNRVLRGGALFVPLAYAAIAAVALMAVPVAAGPDGPQTPLGAELVDAPVLGVVASFEPGWLAEVMQWLVVGVATPVLVVAAGISMLGLSRHAYVLATNRQIPSWAGKLERTRSTPYVAIGIGAALSFGLALSGDTVFLAGIFAFGAMLTITIAHVSVLRLRITDPDRERPFRVPLDVTIAGHRLPLPTLVAAVLSAVAWASLFAVHASAVLVGGGWMVFGLVFYVIYRLGVEGTSLTEQVTVPELALKKQAHEAEYSSILVPVFGTPLDDDIVATAGRLADAEVEANEIAPKLRVIFVAELALTVPLDAPMPAAIQERADRALARAGEVGGEYENVEVSSEMIRARSVGAGIVAEAKAIGAEVIVMGAEPPSRVRGGAILGGVGASRPDEIGRVTEYVLRHAPCQVLITAAPD